MKNTIVEYRLLFRDLIPQGYEYGTKDSSLRRDWKSGIGYRVETTDVAAGIERDESEFSGRE